MNITWLIIMIAIFLIPASCFVFGLITAIKYVIKDDTKNYEKFAWISTLGLIGCLIIIYYIILS